MINGTLEVCSSYWMFQIVQATALCIALKGSALSFASIGSSLHFQMLPMLDLAGGTL